MKRMVLSLSVILLTTLLSCSQTANSDENDKKTANISFVETEHDYGTIAYNGEGLCEFKFENTGKEPLVLNNVSSSCGCTVPEWTKEPIDPGKKGSIKVKYNTRIPGKFNKAVTVYSNAPNSPTVLRISGVVENNTPETQPQN